MAATETPVKMWIEGRGVVDEVLLMSGAQLPESGQIPLIDSHMRWSTENVIGSVRNLSIKKRELYGQDHYSKDERAEKIFQKGIEGHLPDRSIVYIVHEYDHIRDGETKKYSGKNYTGHISLAT